MGAGLAYAHTQAGGCRCGSLATRRAAVISCPSAAMGAAYNAVTRVPRELWQVTAWAA